MTWATQVDVSHRTAVNTDGEVTNAEVEDQERTQTLDTEFWCCKIAAAFSVVYCFYLLELQSRAVSCTSHGRTITQNAHVHPHAP